MMNSIKIFLTALKLDLVDTWNRCKILVFAILAVVGFIEWDKIKAILLTYAANKEMKSDNAQDQVLSTQEDAAKAQAAALVKDAQNLPNQQTQVSQDWYVKKGDGQ